VGFWDADLATPLEAIDRLREVLTERPGIEIVFGSRVAMLGRRIQRRPIRHYAGRAFATVVSIVLGLPVYDTQCGAKVFRCTPVLPTLFEEPFLSRWVFDVELIARRIRAEQHDQLPPTAGAIFEFPLEKWTDVPGSKLRLHDFVRATWDVLKIRRVYLA
jgi:hypothetical protein